MSLLKGLFLCAFFLMKKKKDFFAGKFTGLSSMCFFFFA